MALPRQVEATLKEIEALEKQLSDGQTPAPTEPAHAAEVVQAQATQGEAQPAEQTATPTKVDQPAEATPEKPAEPVVAEETWQQKYRTLKGMYDADVPRLHAQVKELNNRLVELQRAAADTPKPTAQQATTTKLVTDEDVQAFGADLIEVQRKVAREVAQDVRAEIDALKADNAKLREQLQATGTQVVEATFEQRLHRMVPDFDAVNADPKWIEWLNEVDPILRAPRKAVAQEAFNRGDADGVAYYVDLFKKSSAPVEQPRATSKADEVARQIQPNRVASTGTPVSQTGKTYTNADIQKMFQKAADLGGRGQLEAARKLEAEIDAAFMEGRVTA